MKKKGQVMWSDIKGFVLAGLVLIIMLVGIYFVLGDRLSGYVERAINWVRFGG